MPFRRLRHCDGERVGFDLLLNGVDRADGVVGEPSVQPTDLVRVQPLRLDAERRLLRELRAPPVRLVFVERRTEERHAAEPVVDSRLLVQGRGELLVELDSPQQEARVVARRPAAADLRELGGGKLACGAAARLRGHGVALDDHAPQSVMGGEEVGGAASDHPGADDDDVGGGRGGAHPDSRTEAAMASPWNRPSYKRCAGASSVRKTIWTIRAPRASVKPAGLYTTTSACERPL